MLEGKLLSFLKVSVFNYTLWGKWVLCFMNYIWRIFTHIWGNNMLSEAFPLFLESNKFHLENMPSTKFRIILTFAWLIVLEGFLEIYQQSLVLRMLSVTGHKVPAADEALHSRRKPAAYGVTSYYNVQPGTSIHGL